MKNFNTTTNMTLPVKPTNREPIRAKEPLFEITIKAEMFGGKPYVSVHVTKDTGITPELWQAVRNYQDHMQKLYDEGKL